MTYAPVPFATERQRVAAFARAVGADPEAGVPPTYAFVGVFASAINVVLDPALQVNVGMLVHGEQEFTWERHPEVGEDLTAETAIGGDEQRRGLRFLRLETEVKDAEGRPAVRSRMLNVIR